MKKIQDLIEAGKKATQGEFIFIKKTDKHNVEYSDQGGYSIEVDGHEIVDDRTYYNTAPDICNAEFLCKAANARTEIETLYKLAQEMVDALENVLGCFNAAYAEGLHDVLQNQEVKDEGSLYGLVTRRLLFAVEKPQETLTKWAELSK